MSAMGGEDRQAGVGRAVARIRATYARWTRDTPPAQMRADWDALFAVAHLDADVQPVDMGGLAGAWVSAPNVDPQAPHTLLYLHGGGFSVGSVRSHAELMAGLSQACGCRVLGVDYRLAPEHPLPAAPQDAMAAWQWLLGQGVAPHQTAVAGDSAGGGLALGLLLALRDAGKPMPAAAVTLSAWTDLSASGRSYDTHAALDPIHQRALIRRMARLALGAPGGADGVPDAARLPANSPLLADLHGLPPLLMQVGGAEVLLSDSQDLADKARAAGVPAELQVWPGMIHVFQQFPAELPDALLARQAMGRFVRRHFGTGTLATGTLATSTDPTTT